MTIAWKCIFLLHFLPLEILRLDSKVFHFRIWVKFYWWKSRFNLLPPSCPLSLLSFLLLPSLPQVKKIIQKYSTECEESHFLHLGTSQFDIENSPDLISIWPWTSQSGKSCCSSFSLLPASMYSLFPTCPSVNTSFVILYSVLPWVSDSC